MGRTLTDKQVEDVSRAFKSLDTDKCDRIKVDDLPKLMQLLGQNPTVDEEQDMKTLYGRDCDTFSLDEVINIVQTIGLKSQEEVYEELMLAFRAIDADSNGSITKQELKKYMQRMGDPLTDAELDEMVSLADADNSGTVEWNEFVAVLSRRIM